MYLPRQFDTPEHGITLMQSHPFASLITTDDDGFPFVTHLPLKWVPGAGQGLLLGHCARANPQWNHLRARSRGLAVFQGPHAYLSPSVYPDLQRVPTWNYLAVHARVTAQLLDDAQIKDALLKQLIADHEPAYADQWRALSATYTDAMLRGIVAFELHIDALQVKVKLNQHRPESHARMREVYTQGGENERGLADWMQRLGLVA